MTFFITGTPFTLLLFIIRFRKFAKDTQYSQQCSRQLLGEITTVFIYIFERLNMAHECVTKPQLWNLIFSGTSFLLRHLLMLLM